MKYFLEVCKCGSIKKASETLFISQQALSSAIRRLEHELECHLFYRKPTGLVLTEQGEYFRQESTKIVEQFDTLQKHYTSLHQSNSLITIACTYNLLSRCPKQLQRLLLGPHEEFTASTKEFFSTECEEQIENEGYIFGLVYGPIDISKFAGHNLFGLEQCFVVHKEHPLAQQSTIHLNDLDGEKLILPDVRSKIYSYIVDMMFSVGVTPQIAFECDRPMQIRDLLYNNHSFVARMLECDAKALDDPDICILQLEDIDFTQHVYFIHKRSKRLTMTERVFKQTVLNLFKFQ